MATSLKTGKIYKLNTKMSRKQTQKVFSNLCKAVSIGCCLPFKWNSASKTLHVISENDNESQTFSVQRRHTIRLNIHRAIMLLFICQELLTAHSASLSIRILRWLAVLCFIMQNIFLNWCTAKCHEISLYINGVFQFGDKMGEHWVDRRRTLTDHINLAFCISLTIAIFIFPAYFLIRVPNTSLIGYWLLIKGKSTLGKVLTCFVLLFNFWAWTVGMCAMVFCVGGVLVLLTISLQDCIHTFWNFESTSGSIPFFTRSALFRQIQLLNMLQREVQAIPLQTAFMGVATTAMSMMIFVVIRSDVIPTRIPFCWMIVCALILLFVVGGQAGVMSESNRMLRDFARAVANKRLLPLGLTRWEYRLQQRFWKSCRNLIKVHFGIDNFIDELTPLSCLNLGINLTVKLLLLAG